LEFGTSYTKHVSMNKERKNYALPAEVGGKIIYLPDYTTLIVDGVELQVHPNHKKRFLKQNRLAIVPEE